jgi:hypothetical protein
VVDIAVVERRSTQSVSSPTGEAAPDNDLILVDLCLRDFFDDCRLLANEPLLCIVSSFGLCESLFGIVVAEF